MRTLSFCPSSYQTAEDLNGTTVAETRRQDALVVDWQESDVDLFEEIPPDKRLSPLDAAIHLVKGNLGPGCLNLPHAFALSGWALGSGLFLLIALQGIYSMWLLVYCKNVLPSSRHTFMDVAKATLGPVGGHLVEVFLFVLQGGVCCVFLSLIRTNLRAFLPWLSDIASVLIVTILLMLMVLLRFLKDLLWLSATANVIMVIAILTATVAGLVHFNAADPDIIATNPVPSVLITFTSDMFFAFEGIGLVLPVENNYYSQKYSFSSILIGSMTLVACLFCLIGVTASLGFPGIHSGSVTAFLEKQYPGVFWYSFINAMVIVAVALTFPLQLKPAMEVLDQWLDQRSCCHKHYRQEHANASIEVTKYSVAQQHEVPTVTDDDSFQDVASVVSSLDRRTACCGVKVWIIRRWLMVLGCAFVVYWVNNLGLLIMAVGAIGQTGLAGMPCAIHLAMQYQGMVVKKRLQIVLDVVILIMCAIVMVSGLATSITEIIEAS